MEIINSVLGWFQSADWTQIIVAVGAWMWAFQTLAKLTPTTKDDSIVNWLYSIFAVLGVKVPDLETNSEGKIVAS